MKLGAALTLRADLSRELGPLRNAVREYARYSVLAKTGKAVNLQEDPETLLQTYLAKNNQLVKLIMDINHTNAVTAIGENLTLDQALVQRDALATEAKFYRELQSFLVNETPVSNDDEDAYLLGYNAPSAFDIAKARKEGYDIDAAMSEINKSRQDNAKVARSVISLDEGKKRANDAARRYRELDLQIQEANWATDLIER